MLQICKGDWGDRGEATCVRSANEKLGIEVPSYLRHRVGSSSSTPDRARLCGWDRVGESGRGGIVEVGCIASYMILFLSVWHVDFWSL
jgi:hypothetical protein